MRTESNTGREYKLAIRLVAVAVVATSLVVIYGWLTETWALVTIFPCEPAMKFNVAVCFLQIGAALFLQTIRLKEDAIKMLLGLLCLPMFTLALFTAFQTLFNVDLYADDFFITDTYTPTVFPDSVPGRMSVLTAFCFVLASVGIMLRPLKNNFGDGLFQAMLHLVSITTVVILVSHLLGYVNFQKLSPYTYMPVSTAVLLFGMTAGASLLRPHAGLAGLIFKSKNKG